MSFGRAEQSSAPVAARMREAQGAGEVVAGMSEQSG